MAIGTGLMAIGLMAMRSHRQKQSELATRQRIQMIAGNREKLKGGREDSSLELSERAWPCLISDFCPLEFVLRNPVCGILLP